MKESEMKFDIAIGSAVVTFLMSLFALIGVIKNFLSSGTKENAEAITRMCAALDGLASRLQKVENELEHLPSVSEINQLSTDIAYIKGELKAVNKSLEASERSLRRVENFLLNAKGGSL